jgi:glutathione synthase
MRIAFVVNDVDTEHPKATTTLLAQSAQRAGHRVHLIGVRELTCRSDGHVVGIARQAPSGNKRSEKTFIESMQGRDAPREEISTEDLDVMWLRYNPTEEVGETAWAREAGVLIGGVAVAAGVLVLNHPFRLPHAMSKIYLMHLPADARPPTAVTRSLAEVQRFREEHGGRVVLKPLEGHGGQDVFLVEEDGANIKQLMETIGRTGYVMVQPYLEEASEGDVRLFLMNGRPLEVDGVYAAMRRRGEEGDFRSNISAGGTPEAAQPDERALRLAELLRPRLVADGMFFVGLDIIGDRLVEVNTISSGALRAAGLLHDVDFGAVVIEAIERKVRYKDQYRGRLGNRELATLD